MITKDMSDKDRAELLRTKKLKVAPWDISKELVLTDPDKTIKNAIRDFTKALGILGTSMPFNEYSHDVIFTKDTLEESIGQTIKSKGDLLIFAKALTIIDKITANAILIEVENYRHKSRKEAKVVNSVWQFLSGFTDGIKIYPIKITIKQQDTKNSSQFHMILSIGSIKMEVQQDAKGASGTSSRESLPNQCTSFEISIPDFLQKCNRNHKILLKHFPDEMLSDKQKEQKKKSLQKDIAKETAQLIQKKTPISQIQSLQAQSRANNDIPEERQDGEEEMELW